MSLLDAARAALEEIPLQSIVRERLSLALDRLADAEARLVNLQAQNAVLREENQRLKAERDEACAVLQRLRDEQAEEARVFKGVEFRRGKRTGGAWIVCCPVCHVPADSSSGLLRCPTGKCGWEPLLDEKTVRQWPAQF